MIYITFDIYVTIKYKKNKIDWSIFTLKSHIDWLAEVNKSSLFYFYLIIFTKVLHVYAKSW